MSDDSAFVDYAHDAPGDPLWLRRQREEAMMAGVRPPSLPAAYEERVRIGELNVEALRKEHPHAPGLSDEDVRRLEHPEEFPA